MHIYVFVLVHVCVCVSKCACVYIYVCMHNAYCIESMIEAVADPTYNVSTPHILVLPVHMRQNPRNYTPTIHQKHTTNTQQTHH